MLQAQIFIDKDTFKGAVPLYEFIMEFLLGYNIMGATLFRGQMGFGANQKLKHPDRVFSFDEPPALIIFIDQEEKVLQVLKQLRQEVSAGFIVTQKVDVFTVDKNT
jgi:PII-like signaling protein